MLTTLVSCSSRIILAFLVVGTFFIPTARALGYSEGPCDLSVDVDSWDFGDVEAGTFVDKLFVLSNSVAATSNCVGNAIIEGSTQFSVVSGENFDIASGASHEVVVRFLCPPDVGDPSATLRLESNDPDGTVAVSLTGECVAATSPDIALDKTSLDFGDVEIGAELDLILVVSNNGTGNLQVSASNLVGPDAAEWEVTNGAAPFSLAAGETHELTVCFSPISTGPKNATLRFISNDADGGVTNVLLIGNDFRARVSQGLVVFYNFDAGSGDIVADKSANGSPMDLTITGSVTWSPDENGLVMSGGKAGTTGEATKVIDALKFSNRATFEVWLTPETLSQNGPARMISLGSDDVAQNFMLGQSAGNVEGRLLHTAKDAKAKPRLVTDNNFLTTTTTHLTYTFDGATERLFVNGIMHPAEVALAGIFSNWHENSKFNLGNETTLDRAWNGTVRLVAVYDRALDEEEIIQNFAAGPTGIDPPIAENQSLATPEDIPVDITLTGSAPLGGPLTFELTKNPRHGSLTGSAPDITYTPDPDFFGDDSLQFKVNDGVQDSERATAIITVNPVNDPPVAKDRSVTTQVDSPVAISLRASDVEGDPLTFTILQDPASGTLTGTAPDLTYTPNTGFLGSDSLKFNANDGQDDSNTALISITVTSEPQICDLAVDPQTLNFGKVQFGTFVDTTFVLFNGQSATANCVGWSGIMGSEAYTIVSGEDFDIAPGESHELVVRFDCDRDPAMLSATLRLESNDADGAIDVALNGECVEADIAVEPANLDFGDLEIGLELDLILVVSNQGTADLEVTDTDLAGTNADEWEVTKGAAPFTLAPGGNREVTVCFNPDTEGVKSAQLVIRSNDPDENPLEVQLTGNGLAVPDIVVTPEHLDFGDDVAIGEEVDLVVLISNVRTGDLEVTATELVGSDANQWAVTAGAAPFTLAPGEEREVMVCFNPTSGGHKNAKLRIESNDPDESVVHVLLIGNDTRLRVSDGLVVFYNFDEGSGAVVGDKANNGLAMDLTISGGVAWRADEDGVVMSDGRVGTQGNADKLTQALKASNRASFEIWLKPENLKQEGPARMVSVGESASAQNFMLGQVEDDVEGRLLHTAKDAKAKPRLTTDNAFLATNLTHIVYTFDGTNERMFVNGQQHPATVAKTGNFSNWDNDVKFSIGNEASLDRPWRGIVRLVAVYDRALQEDDIIQNFASGPVGAVHAPIAQPQSVATAEDTPTEITLTATDLENDPLTFSLVNGPENGTLSGTLPNITYTPTENFFGQDSFTFKSNDGLQDSDTASVSISVNPVNDAPVADAQSVATLEDTALEITLTATDAEGDALTFHIVDAPVSGVLSGTPPSVIYTPNSGFHGSDAFTFKASDGDADGNAATVSIVVHEPQFCDLLVNPDSLGIAGVDVGSFVDNTIVLSNSADATINCVGSGTITSESGFSIVSGGSFDVAPGASHDLIVRFDCRRDPGEIGAVLRLESNDPAGAVEVPLTGECVELKIPDIAVEPSSLDFGDLDVGAVLDSMVVVVNNGQAKLEVRGLTFVGNEADQFALIVGGIPFTVMPGGNHEITVKFAPTAPGAKTAVLRLQSNDPDTASFEVPLSGNGTAAVVADIAIDLPSHDFGIVNLEVKQTCTFQVSNEGGASLQVSKTTLINGATDQYAIESGGAPFTLAPGASRELVVSARPSLPKTQRAIMRIRSNDTDEGLLDVPLTMYVNSPPSSPDLLEPAWNAVAQMWSWRRSADPDEGHELRYTFEISSDDAFTQIMITLEGLSETTVTAEELDESHALTAGSFYYWRVKAIDNHGGASGFSAIGYFQYLNAGPTAVEDPTHLEIPTEFALAQNYPNPFNPETQIRYEVPITAIVTLTVFDIQGQQVRRILQAETRSPGVYTVTWDGRDNAGSSIPSGVYFYRIMVNAQDGGQTPFVQTRKLTLLK